MLKALLAWNEFGTVDSLDRLIKNFMSAEAKKLNTLKITSNANITEGKFRMLFVIDCGAMPRKVVTNY